MRSKLDFELFAKRGVAKDDRQARSRHRRPFDSGQDVKGRLGQITLHHVQILRRNIEKTPRRKGPVLRDDDRGDNAPAAVNAAGRLASHIPSIADVQPSQRRPPVSNGRSHNHVFTVTPMFSRLDPF